MSTSPHRHPRSARMALAVAAVAPLALTAITLPSQAAPVARAAEPTSWFDRVATYPVFQNVPAGVDPAEATVAEISSVSPDGNTVAYTDALGGRIGFLDISDPEAPSGLGSHDVSGSAAGGSPTSVSVVPSGEGDVALVVVDESTYPGLEDTEWEDEAPAVGLRDGRLDVVSLQAPHDEITSLDLGGQPDSIAISPDGSYAAIAMENQRNEAVTPDGGDEGDLPQDPAGFVQIIDLSDPDPTTWEVTPVELTAEDLAGLDTPEDAEPEYVDINDDNQLALSLQENNGVVIIDLETATVETAWSAGNAVVEGVDTTDDGVFNATDTIDVPREPDALAWVGDGLVATANEGDWKGGSRGWTVFDAATGDVEWDAGNSFENLAVAHGLFNDGRADNKGAEPEGIAFDEFDGTPYAFVGSERSNFVAVYDMTEPTAPAFVQVLPATNGPEGLLPIPERDLFVVSSEEDDAGALVRATVGVYELGADEPAFPSIVSEIPTEGTPIGWGALGALSAVPGDADRAYTASDAAYATGRIYGVDLSQNPAVIDEVIEVTEAGATPAIDIEGLSARKGGGFWVAREGATGVENQLVRLAPDGSVEQRVDLPTGISAHVRNWGLEGVSVVGTGTNEQVYAVLQRPLWVDPTVGAGAVVPLEGNVARIARYTPAEDTWEWFSYPLETTAVAGDWIGLSEITVIDRGVDSDTLAIIERDKQNGTTAALKRVYTVEAPRETEEEVTALAKELAVDMLPLMQAQHGWTQEKLEGFTVTAGGELLAVTDNDGVDDATGETQLYRLGDVRDTFGHATSTTLTARPKRVRQGQPVRITVRVDGTEGGTVRVLDGKRKIVVKKLSADGEVTLRKRLKPGVHRLRAVFNGTTLAEPSRSETVTVRVVKKKRR